jgi:hypothetical protein
MARRGTKLLLLCRIGDHGIKGKSQSRWGRWQAELMGKKYVPPKQSGTVGDWEVILTLQVTVEGGNYAG